MGAPLTQYDIDLGQRIESFSKRERYSQSKMAEFMGVPLERYKRFIYGQAKIPSEAVAKLIESVPVDPDYILFGREGGVMKLTEYLLGCSDKERADFHMEMARAYRRREENSGVDYEVDNKTIIETDKKARHK